MDIFGLHKSKLRKDLLKLYFSHPEKKYYLRQLERITNKPVSYIRQELIKLEKAGLFFSQFQGKERYFGLNKKFPLYREVEKIVSKTVGIEGSLKNILAKIAGIRSAFIFGSFARGNKDELSDVDLFIIGSPDEDKLTAAISRLESKVEREINYHIFSQSDFLKRVKKRNSFARSVLNNPKIFLIGDEKSLPGAGGKRADEKGKN